MPISISQYGKVTGTFQSFSGGDSNRDDIPDILSYSGTGYITCSAKEVRVTGENPRTIIPAPVHVTVGLDGKIFFDGDPYVYLLAPGPHTNPPTFNYILRLKVQLGDFITRYDSPFIVQPGVEDDLANLLVVEETPSKLVTAGPRGLSMYDLAIQSGAFSGTEAEFIAQYMDNNSSTVTLTPDPDNEGFFKAV